MWIKNLVPSLYFTANNTVNQITLPADYDISDAAIGLDRYGVETNKNWAFRVMSLEQAKKKLNLTDKKYNDARKAITTAGSNYKKFISATLMTETVTFEKPGDDKDSPSGETMKGVKGLNYNILKHALYLFEKPDWTDPTKCMVWSYKLMWEAYLHEKKEYPSTNKDPDYMIRKMANDSVWDNLTSAVRKDAKGSRDKIAKSLLGGRGIEIYDGGKYVLDGPMGGRAGDIHVHATSYYALSPTYRFNTDKMIKTDYYGKGGFVPKSLDILALAYVPRKYYIPFKSTSDNAALPRYQHGHWTNPALKKPYRAQAFKALKPKWTDRSTKGFGKRRIYDPVIQQALETESAWQNLGFDGDGTKHLFKSAGSSITDNLPYWSAYNPVFPFAPNAIDWYRGNDPKYFSNTKGWAPFSVDGWIKLSTAKGYIDEGNNVQWVPIMNPTGRKSKNGNWGLPDNTFGIAGLKEIVEEVDENYGAKQYKYGGEPWSRHAVFAFLRTGPAQMSWGMKSPFTTAYDAQTDTDKRAFKRWKKALDYLWDKGLNMGYTSTGKGGTGHPSDAWVLDGTGGGVDVVKWGKTKGWINDAEGLRQKNGGRKEPVNLLNPLYRVEISTPQMTCWFRIMLHMLDTMIKGIIPDQRYSSDDYTTKSMIPFSMGNDGDYGMAALHCAVDMCWALLYEFAEVDAKVTKVQEANKSVPKDSKLVVSGKGADTQVLENMQCFMLNLVDVFAKFHKGSIAPAYGMVSGDNTNIYNLLGYKPETVDMMLRMTPNQLARMQPRIKLYKERTVYKKNSNVILRRDMVEVAGPMATHTDIKSVEMALAQGMGRNLGGGIKEITVKEESGDMVNADVPSDDTIEISFIFNTLQEIFLNFPRFDENGNHAGFPYGVMPRYAHLKPEDVPASYAELVFPMSQGQKDEYIQVVNMFRESFNIILELGWSPPDNLKALSPYEKAVFDKLRQRTLYRTFVLQPFDTEFNFTNEGQVELVTKYKGIQRYQQSRTINRLFPIGGISDTSKLKDDKEIVEAKKTIVKYTKQKKGAIKGKSRVLSAVESAKLARARSLIQDKIDVRQSAEFDHFIREQLDDLMKGIYGVHPGNIYVLNIPTALLGARTGNLSDGVIKWQTNRDIELLKQFPKNVTRIPYHKGAKAGNVGSKVMNAAKTASKKNNPENLEEMKKLQIKVREITAGWTGSKEDLKKEIEKIKAAHKANLKKISTAVKKAAKKTQQEGATAPMKKKNTSNTWPLYFMFYGDVVGEALEFSWEQLEILQERINKIIGTGNKKEKTIDLLHNQTEHTHLILGSVKIPIVSGGKMVTHNINIADLPMTTAFFSEFIIDTLITPSAYGITKIDFCEKLLKRLIMRYFNSTCFYDGAEVTQTSPQIHYFTVPMIKGKTGVSKYRKRKYPNQPSKWKYTTDDEALWRHDGSIAASSGKEFTRYTFKSRMNEIEKELNSRPELSKQPHYKYAFLGTRSFAEGDYDFKKDLAENIHHFYFGAGEGLVKNVSFKSEEMDHMAEAVFYEGVQMPGTEIDAFIPRIFNVDLTMVGNTLFRTGHTFYLDPTMGTMLGNVGSAKKRGVDIIENTGLGGYFYIASIETRIAPGVYETTIEGIKTGVAKNKDRRREKSFTPTSLDQDMSKMPPIDIPKPK